MTRFDVTTIGEGQLRYSVPAGRRLEEATQFDVHPSGTEANVVCLLARLGWQTGWVSALPNSPLGRRVAHAFRPCGVDLSAVLWRDNTRLATYYVEYATPPRSTQVYYDRAHTAFTRLTQSDIDWDYLLDTRLLHISGLTLPLSLSVAMLLIEAVKRAKAANIPVSFDMNYRTRLWSPENARQVIEPIIKRVDILFFARRDAQQIFGLEGEPEALLHYLGTVSEASFIVSSLSHDGIIGWDRETVTHVPARQVGIIDRIGAGDAMVAGVLHGWLQGNFTKGLRYGALTAGLALSQFGDQVMTNKEEVEALLKTIDSTDITR